MSTPHKPGKPLSQEHTGTTTEGLGIAPSIGPILTHDGIDPHPTLLRRRDFFMCLFAIGLGIVGSGVALLLLKLIGLLTNICFYGRFSFAFSDPTARYLGGWVILIPVIGGLVVGMMARYGSEAIRGHGIPEAMESILLRQSRIPPRLTFLKPLSAIISIGTGGPFGAEGPIIATGGALGSLVGQIFKTSADERKTLLAAGAAAGMAATFGAPVSSVLMAVELLLFEFRPRSLLPVALASAIAAGLRMLVMGTHPIFAMPSVPPVHIGALLIYGVLGALVGGVAALITRTVYAVEDGFHKYVPIHWMWWPAIGAIVVGICGYFDSHTLGVGYDHISAVLKGDVALRAMIALGLLKWISWSFSLGSGTSGGTVAPLFTMGSSFGAVLAVALLRVFPNCGVSVSVAALVGMAALFTGSTRAILTSIVFAVETTMQPRGLLPLLAGCSTSFLFSCLLLKNTILTEKLSRRGVRVPGELMADFMDRLYVRDAATWQVITLPAHSTVYEIRARFFTNQNVLSHHDFPVVDENQNVIGMIGYRELLNPNARMDQPISQLALRPAVFTNPDHSLRDADRLMERFKVGRLLVADPAQPAKVKGIITRSDLLAAHRLNN